MERIDNKERKMKEKEYSNYIYDLDDAPTIIKLNNNISYNCTKCPSPIEIKSIDENNIEFECTNNHHLKMEIKDFLNEMRMCNYTKNNINSDQCQKHNYQFLNYCIDCEKHLCKECLKTGYHIYHNKIFLSEILPEKEILNKLIEKIRENKKREEEINLENIKRDNQLKRKINNNTEIIEGIIEERKKIIKNERNEEIKENEENYKKKIQEIKEEYKNKLKKLKIEYKFNINKIENKYKKRNDINLCLYHHKIDKLNKYYGSIKNNDDYQKKIEKIKNINNLTEILYSTYHTHKKNLYNINNIINL